MYNAAFDPDIVRFITIFFGFSSSQFTNRKYIARERWAVSVYCLQKLSMICCRVNVWSIISSGPYVMYLHILFVHTVHTILSSSFLRQNVVLLRCPCECVSVCRSAPCGRESTIRSYVSLLRSESNAYIFRSRPRRWKKKNGEWSPIYARFMLNNKSMHAWMRACICLYS